MSWLRLRRAPCLHIVHEQLPSAEAQAPCTVGQGLSERPHAAASAPGWVHTNQPTAAMPDQPDVTSTCVQVLLDSMPKLQLGTLSALP